MAVEMLHTMDCPNAVEFLPRLQALVADAGLIEPIQVRRIDDVEQAERERFLGSPTVRVNGRDVDPSAGRREDYGLSCRLYAGPDGLRGTPPDEWVLTALRLEPQTGSPGAPSQRMTAACPSAIEEDLR
jgi:hypothetical protein